MKIENVYNYFRLADTLADFNWLYCEVVIHSFESLGKLGRTVNYYHHTGREIGSPITDLGLQAWSTFEKTMKFLQRVTSRMQQMVPLLKSTTCVLAGPQKKLIGMLCINMNHPSHSLKR